MSFIGVAAGGAVLGAGASIFSGIQQGNAARSAARTQAGATDRATELQRELYRQTRTDLAPYRGAGESALATLRQIAARYSGGPELTADPALPEPYVPEPFTGETIDLFRDPSYQFRVNEGLRAIEHRTASRGMLQSGNTLKDLTRFGQEAATQEYQGAYNRALAASQQQAQLGQQGYANQFQSNQAGYNRAIDLYGLRRTRAIEDQRNIFNQYQALANYGSAAASQQAAANQQLGSQVGENILQRGNALSAGQIGAANAFSGGLQGVANTGLGALNNYFLLSSLNQPGGQPFYSGGNIPPSQYYAPLP